MKPIAFIFASALALAPLAALADGGQIIEKIQTYAIPGRTGIDLYRSIGERGPKLGTGRTIAHTSFRLTWRRTYEPQGTRCVLTAAIPKLIITYTLPKPTEALPPALKASWKTFIDSVAAHEKVHGESIKTMVAAIEAASVGRSAENDPQCRQIRIDLTKRLGELSAEQRRRDTDFDRVEMAKDGHIQQLILALVNGP